jgi:hypothetical protein
MGSLITSAFLGRKRGILARSGVSGNPNHTTEVRGLRKIADPCVFVAFCCMIAKREVKALFSICDAVTPGRSFDEIPPTG